MAVTINGTSGITFNDTTSQTTAATAPTTTQVLNATAGASVGAVGTYGFFFTNPGTPNLSPGTTRAGSSLQYSASSLWSLNCGSWSNVPTSAQPYGTTPSGTWRCMGFTASSNQNTLFLRIS